jgi:hypothetical protein
MSKITIKDLLSTSVEWTIRISQFYADYREENTDVFFRKLLTTMIDQEGEYTENYKENLIKLNIQMDFNMAENDQIEFDTGFEDIPSVKGMLKIEFLKKAVNFQDCSIKICDFLGLMSKTNKSKQIFKGLADEERRHMFIFKDHLELEELF